MEPKELLDLMLKRLFYRCPDYSSWDGDSEEIPTMIDRAHNECFTLTDYPHLHSLIDAYCMEHGIHTQEYGNEPE